MDAGSHRFHAQAPIFASIGLRDVLDGAPDLIFACDGAGRLLWLNAAVEELTGRGRGELIGQSIGALIPAHEWRRVVRFFGAERRRGALLSSIEAPVEVRCGSLTPVAVRVRRFEGPEGASFYVGVARESSADADASAELELRLAQLTASLEEARTVAQLKADSLATMTHEIRSPMNGIMGLLQILMEGELDREQRGIVEILQHSGRTLLAMVNDTLEFSRLEAGKVELHHADFDLVNTVHDVASLLGPIANEKALEFDCRIAGEVPRFLRGDPGRIRQVLMNLASNAIKFTDRGRVAIRVERLHARADGFDLWFAVTDSGIGIAPDAVARLFQPYEQANAAIAHRFGGTGLGLSICRKLVTLMGGEMGVESSLGEGSTFWFRLTLPPASGPCESAAPLSSSPHGAVVLAGLAQEIGGLKQEGEGPAAAAKPAEEPREPMRDHGAVGGAARAAGRGRILVVEDSYVNQLVAVWSLQRLGHQVDTASSGEEALARCARERYDVVLLDLTLPDGSGLEVARRLRGQEAPGGHRATLAAMTGAAGEDARRRCLEAGMDDFLAKPIDLDRLTTRVGEWMARGSELGVEDPGASRDPAPPARPAIDLGRLEITSMGSVELRTTLLSAFVGECDPRMVRLETAVSAGDVRSAEFEAHGLKGMSGTIGAVAAEELFASIEHGARNGDLAAIGPLMRRVRCETARIAEFIRTLPTAEAA